jgi:hypothetical protein
VGSLTIPRRDVVAVWPNARVTLERVQQSTHPQRDFFTSVPPESVLLPQIVPGGLFSSCNVAVVVSALPVAELVRARLYGDS